MYQYWRQLKTFNQIFKRINNKEKKLNGKRKDIKKNPMESKDIIPKIIQITPTQQTKQIIQKLPITQIILAKVKKNKKRKQI